MDIREIREAKNWTQDQMADYLGLDRSSVSRMECGRPPSGPVEKLLQLLERDMHAGFREVAE